MEPHLKTTPVKKKEKSSEKSLVTSPPGEIIPPSWWIFGGTDNFLPQTSNHKFL